MVCSWCEYLVTEMAELVAAHIRPAANHHDHHGVALRYNFLTEGGKGGSVVTGKVTPVIRSLSFPKEFFIQKNKLSMFKN